MKKGYFSFFVLFIVSVIAFVGCSNEPSNSHADSTVHYDKEFWGEWRNLNQTESWKINNNKAYLNEEEITITSISKTSDSIIEVVSSKGTSHLYAIRTASASVTGTVNDLSSSRGLGDGGIVVVVQNTDNPEDIHQVTTDDNGEFTVNDIIPGDHYRVKPGNNPAVNVRPSFDGEHLGTFNLRQGLNFKVTLEGVPEVMFTDTEYELNLVITNTGSEKCTAATYELEGDNGFEAEITDATIRESNLLRTIVPDGTVSIPLRVSCPDSGSTVIKNIYIQIEDINGTTWNDSVSMKFYSGKTILSLNSESDRPINGFVIGNGHTFAINSQTSCAIEVPSFDGDYIMVFAGAKATLDSNTECIYSIGVNSLAFAQSNLASSLSKPSIYEPNNTESTATRISNEQNIVAYLHDEDIDYYKIDASHAVSESVFLLVKDSIIDSTTVPAITDQSTMSDLAKLKSSNPKAITIGFDETIKNPTASSIIIKSASDVTKDYVLSVTYTGKAPTFTTPSLANGGKLYSGLCDLRDISYTNSETLQTTSYYHLGHLKKPFVTSSYWNGAENITLRVIEANEKIKNYVTVCDIKNAGDSFSCLLDSDHLQNGEHYFMLDFDTSFNKADAYVHVQYLDPAGTITTAGTDTYFVHQNGGFSCPTPVTAQRYRTAEKPNYILDVPTAYEIHARTDWDRKDITVKLTFYESKPSINGLSEIVKETY